MFDCKDVKLAVCSFFFASVGWKSHMSREIDSPGCDEAELSVTALICWHFISGLIALSSISRAWPVLRAGNQKWCESPSSSVVSETPRAPSSPSFHACFVPPFWGNSSQFALVKGGGGVTSWPGAPPDGLVGAPEIGGILLSLRR